MDNFNLTIIDTQVAGATEIQLRHDKDFFNNLSALLNKMINENFEQLIALLYRIDVSEKKLKNILATGGTGTIKSYYQKDAGYIFAKTGTLNNNCALSGFLITKKNKLYIFSVLANNYLGGATPIRRAVEKFLTEVREKN